MTGATERRREIGQRLRAARERADLTLEELAQRVGRDRSQLSRIENGERRLDSVLLFDLADALDVEVDQMLVSGRALVLARSKGQGDPVSEDPHTLWGSRLLERLGGLERLAERYGL